MIRRILNNIKIGKNVNIGKNNYIGKNVIIKDNVTIGNNNKIYDNCIIYPNTLIGNNNIFLPRNIIGEIAVQSSYTFETFMPIYNGLEIGNNNFFHCDNIIFNGYDNKTIIGNNNKLLAENHIGHDTQIHNNVTIYPRCITGGYSILLNNSVMGFYSTLQQRMVLGNYSMIAAGNNVSHNVFPFYIFLNNQYHRINKHQIDDKLFNLLNDTEIRNIISDIKESKEICYNKINVLDEPIKNIINNFFDHTINNRV